MRRALRRALEGLTLADPGGLMAEAPNWEELTRRAASFVARILKGARPADLPIEPTGWALIIDLRAAKDLGLAMPPSLLRLADHIIE